MKVFVLQKILIYRLSVETSLVDDYKIGNKRAGVSRKYNG